MRLYVLFVIFGEGGAFLDETHILIAQNVRFVGWL
jgi:hypothetical protein